MKIMSSTTVLCIAAFLTGCGDGDGGGNDTNSRASFEELNDEFSMLSEEVQFGTTPVFNPEDLPNSNSVVYQGVVGVKLFNEIPQSEVDIFGNLEVTTNFNNDSISGSASDFADSEDFTYGGIIDITNGQIIRNDNPEFASFRADFDGTLASDQSFENFDVDTLLIGSFYGDNYQYIGGALRGQVTTPQEVLEINDGLDRNGNETTDADGIALFRARR